MVEIDEEDSEAAILFLQAKQDLCKSKPGKWKSGNNECETEISNAVFPTQIL